MRAFSKNSIKWISLVTLATVIIGGVFSVAKGGLTADRCNNIIISIQNPENEPYITNDDIMALLTQNGMQEIRGELFEKLNFTKLESQIKANKQVKSCELHADLRGNLEVEVEPYLPIARILKDNEEDMYLADDGTLFPTSSHYTARVILLSGTYFDNLKSIKSTKRKDFMDFLQFINADEFWKAQFTHLNVNENGIIRIIPLVGNFEIEFGTTDKKEEKLKRLLVFYRQINTVQEWSNFSEISVAYANQIVCK